MYVCVLLCHFGFVAVAAGSVLRSTAVTVLPPCTHHAAPVTECAQTTHPQAQCQLSQGLRIVCTACKPGPTSGILSQDTSRESFTQTPSRCLVSVSAAAECTAASMALMRPPWRERQLLKSPASRRLPALSWCCSPTARSACRQSCRSSACRLPHAAQRPLSG